MSNCSGSGSSKGGAGGAVSPEVKAAIAKMTATTNESDFWSAAADYIDVATKPVENQMSELLGKKTTSIMALDDVKIRVSTGKQDGSAKSDVRKYSLDGTKASKLNDGYYITSQGKYHQIVELKNGKATVVEQEGRIGKYAGMSQPFLDKVYLYKTTGGK